MVAWWNSLPLAWRTHTSIVNNIYMIEQPSRVMLHRVAEAMRVSPLKVWSLLLCPRGWPGADGESIQPVFVVLNGGI
jgi:hypothetical protein